MERHLGAFNKPLERKKPLLICDVTLREGEQTPGVTFTLEEKKEIVRILDAIGVGQIQVAHPRFNERSLEVCHAICAMETRLQKEIMSNGMWDKVYEALDRADACNPDILHSYFMASDYQYTAWSPETTRAMLEKIPAVVEYIKKKGRLCNISLLDATRAPDKAYLFTMIETACKAGADRVRIPDTVGVCDPEGYYELVSRAVEVTSKYGVLLGIHTHNDFGLALANTLAGIRAGADLVDLTVNGLGDRAGNVALAELVVLLEVFYGFNTGIDMSRMKEVSNIIETMAGVKLPVSQPLVGEHVFSDESEMHNLAMRNTPFAYQGFLPAEIGGGRQMIYGKLTTDILIDMTAEHAKRSIDRKHYKAIKDALYDFADANKGVVVTEAVFWNIVRDVEAGN